MFDEREGGIQPNGGGGATNEASRPVSWRARARAFGLAVENILLSPYRLFKFICFSIGFVVLCGFFLVSAYLYGVLSSRPDLSKYDFARLRKAAVASVQKRQEGPKSGVSWVPMKEMSRELVFSVVMGEDATFFDHEGIVYGAMMDAFVENLRRRKYALGASTISQQVVKNVFLTREKTLSRKLREFVITRDLEANFSKNQILEVYLNVAEFGPELYGVGAASRKYFKKSPFELNAAEGALLAVMLPSPKKSFHSIFVNKNISRPKWKKIRRILKDLLLQEVITAEQYSKYLKYDYFAGAGEGAGEEGEEEDVDER